MAIFRINKTENYVTMSNLHFKEKRMSLKAKGLLSQMLSLPDDWDYSIGGLVSINKESEASIKATLKELKQFGYLKITKLYPNETESKRIEYIYDIYEEKQEVENQGVENQEVDYQKVENPTQLNINNKEINYKNIKDKNINNTIYSGSDETKPKTKKVKHKYGEYQNVLLTDEELEKLNNDYTNTNDLITYLDEYIEMKGYKAKSHYLCIKKWVVDAVKQKQSKFDVEKWLRGED